MVREENHKMWQLTVVHWSGHIYHKDSFASWALQTQLCKFDHSPQMLWLHEIPCKQNCSSYIYIHEVHLHTWQSLSSKYIMWKCHNIQLTSSHSSYVKCFNIFNIFCLLCVKSQQHYAPKFWPKLNWVSNIL